MHDRLGDTGNKTGIWLEELARLTMRSRMPAWKLRWPLPTESLAVSTSAGCEPYFLQISDVIEQANQGLLGTPEDIPLSNDCNDWQAVSERRESMSIIFLWLLAKATKRPSRTVKSSPRSTHPDWLTIST
jgi:hypothetical protein